MLRQTPVDPCDACWEMCGSSRSMHHYSAAVHRTEECSRCLIKHGYVADAQRLYDFKIISWNVAIFYWCRCVWLLFISMQSVMDLFCSSFVAFPSLWCSMSSGCKHRRYWYMTVSAARGMYVVFCYDGDVMRGSPSIPTLLRDSDASWSRITKKLNNVWICMNALSYNNREDCIMSGAAKQWDAVQRSAVWWSEQCTRMQWIGCATCLLGCVQYVIHQIEIQRVWPSTVSWIASKVAKHIWGASLGSLHLVDTQIHYRKGVFFAIVDNMTNVIDQTNPLMYSAMKHMTMRSANESMAVTT